MPIGTPLIDDRADLYLHDGGGRILKFSRSGALIWQYDVGKASHHNPAIWNGTLFGTGDGGDIFALDMETGRHLWTSRAFPGYGGDGASVLAHRGLVITVGLGPLAGGNTQLAALSAIDGSEVWRYNTAAPVYNVMPGYCAEKESVVFSDQWGSVYAVRFRDGVEVWKNMVHYSPGTFSTANGVLGPNNVFYAVHNKVSGWDFNQALGCVHAVNALDGSTLWARTFPSGAHASPAVGQLRPGGSLSVVVGLGDNTGLAPAVLLPGWVPSRVKRSLNELSIRLGDWSRFLWWRRPWTGQRVWTVALDAASGKDEWLFETPTWWRPTCAGDEERLALLYAFGVQPRVRGICTCDAWSSPAIGGDGTAYLGTAYGELYALRDANGDGRVAGPGEVSRVDVGAAILMPPSIGPGLLAAVTCDAVIVYQS